MGLFKKKQKSEKETEPEIKKVDVPQKTPPAPELFMLDPYVGCWFSSDVYKPSDLLPDGGEGKSRFDFRLTLNGYCYLADFLGSTPFGEYLWHSIWFYDPVSKMFKIQMYDNFAKSSEAWAKMKTDYPNIKVKTFPKTVLKAMKKATDDVMASYAKKDKLFNEVYSSQKAFMKKARKWTKISEYDYIKTSETVK